MISPGLGLNPNTPSYIVTRGLGDYGFPFVGPVPRRYFKQLTAPTYEKTLEAPVYSRQIEG